MEARKEVVVREERSRRRTSENCNSRHFSWLSKSCIPTTCECDPLSPSATKPSLHHPRTRTKTILSPSLRVEITTATATATTSIASLPDDILLEIFSRLPSLASCTSVCRHWSDLLDSPSLLTLRRRRSLLHPTLFLLSSSSSSDSGPVISSLHLQFQYSPWRFTSPIFPDFNSPSILFRDLFSSSHARTVSIHRKIYLLSRDATAELDPWSSITRILPATLFPRKKFAAAAVNGKIYVAGGSARSSAVEEFDPAATGVTNSWRVVSDAPRKRYGCLGVGMDGIFYVIGGLKIGSSSAGVYEQPPQVVYASSMDLYDVEGRSWMRSRGVPGGGCVVAACGAMGCVYLLTSHAVELSFWRFSVKRKTTINSNNSNSISMEWCRMKSPPLPTQMRVDGMVRFGCAAVGDKLVLIQLMSSGEKNGGIVMVFDCVAEEWSRGPDLPEGMQRATCACVDC